jgi:hypothetical protein
VSARCNNRLHYKIEPRHRLAIRSRVLRRHLRQLVSSDGIGERCLCDPAGPVRPSVRAQYS